MRAALAALPLALGLAGCTGVLVAIDRPGCATERRVEVTREAGKPTRTTVTAHRLCPPPERPTP